MELPERQESGQPQLSVGKACESSWLINSSVRCNCGVVIHHCVYSTCSFHHDKVMIIGMYCTKPMRNEHWQNVTKGKPIVDWELPWQTGKGRMGGLGIHKRVIGVGLGFSL